MHAQPEGRAPRAANPGISLKDYCILESFTIKLVVFCYLTAVLFVFCVCGQALCPAGTPEESG